MAKKLIMSLLGLIAFMLSTQDTSSLGTKAAISTTFKSISKTQLHEQRSTSANDRLTDKNKMKFQYQSKSNILALVLSSALISQTPLMTLALNTFVVSPMMAITDTFLPSKSSSINLISVVSEARPEGVNRPDLLPQDKSQIYPVIDVANFLSKGQEKKVIAAINALEKSTGLKLRLLCQSYPNTPGLAIKDYWGIDDNTVVLVVDRGEGFNNRGAPTNIMHFNIGRNVGNALPGKFWGRLTNKLGNQPYVKANGEDVAVLNAVEAITFCLDKDQSCKDLPFNL